MFHSPASVHLQACLLEGTDVLTGFCVVVAAAAATVVVLVEVGWAQMFPEHTSDRVWRPEKNSKSYFTSHHPLPPPQIISAGVHSRDFTKLITRL